MKKMEMLANDMTQWVKVFTVQTWQPEFNSWDHIKERTDHKKLSSDLHMGAVAKPYLNIILSIIT